MYLLYFYLNMSLVFIFIVCKYVPCIYFDCMLICLLYPLCLYFLIRFVSCICFNFTIVHFYLFCFLYFYHDNAKFQSGSLGRSGFRNKCFNIFLYVLVSSWVCKTVFTTWDLYCIYNFLNYIKLVFPETIVTFKLFAPNNVQDNCNHCDKKSGNI